jgi:hypothetical protein
MTNINYKSNVENNVFKNVNHNNAFQKFATRRESMCVTRLEQILREKKENYRITSSAS